MLSWSSSCQGSWRGWGPGTTTQGTKQSYNPSRHKRIWRPGAASRHGGPRHQLPCDVGAALTRPRPLRQSCGASRWTGGGFNAVIDVFAAVAGQDHSRVGNSVTVFMAGPFSPWLTFHLPQLQAGARRARAPRWGLPLLHPLRPVTASCWRWVRLSQSSGATSV